MRDWQSYLNFTISKQPRLVCAPETLLLITVAFNNLETIKIQYSLLRKYFSNPFCYLVVDNSSDKLISCQIRDYCKEQAIAYARPALRLYRSASKSHGSALNWAYHHLVKQTTCRYFGFLDHDIYPTKTTGILQFLSKQPIYGLLQERVEKWYLWPGFCFFDRQFLVDIRLNFSPQEGLVDTGGMNYYNLYRHLDKTRLIFPNQDYRQIADSQIIQESSVELIGDWLHTFNASGWLKLGNASRRELAISKIITDLLK